LDRLKNVKLLIEQLCIEKKVQINPKIVILINYRFF